MILFLKRKNVLFNKYFNFYIFITCCLINVVYADVLCAVSTYASDFEGDVLCRIDDEVVGQISYEKIFGSSYLLHTLYVSPEHRGSRYSKLLIKKTEEHLSSFAKKIYIQPGAFEKKRRLPSEEKMIKTHQLVRLYRSYDFKEASSREKKIAYWLYKILWIDENPELLMVKDLSK